MSVKTKELIVEVPEYLYDESVKLTSLGLFRDLSDLVAAGMKRELQEAKELLEFEPEDWKEGLARLRAQIRERRAKYGHEEPSEGEILVELRAARRGPCGVPCAPIKTLRSLNWKPMKRWGSCLMPSCLDECGGDKSRHTRKAMKGADCFRGLRFFRFLTELALSAIMAATSELSNIRAWRKQDDISQEAIELYLEPDIG